MRRVAGLTAPETRPLRPPPLMAKRWKRRSPGEAETENVEIANRKGTLLPIAQSQRFVESVGRKVTKQRTAASLTSAATAERRDTWSRTAPRNPFARDVKKRVTWSPTVHSL